MVVGFIGLLSRRWNYPVQAVTFLICLGTCMLTFIGGLFNLDFLSLLYSIQFFAELNPAGSIEYIGITATLIVVIALALKALKTGTNFQSTPFLIEPLAVVLSLSAFDYCLSLGNRGPYNRVAPVGTIFGQGSVNRPLLLLQTARNI